MRDAPVLWTRLVVLVAVAVAPEAFGADWAQWRGAQRNGVVADSPPLVDRFPESGPRQLWRSERIRGAQWGGWGSPVVAGGKVYVYGNPRRGVPTPTRTLTSHRAYRAGWSSRKLPKELVPLVDKARLSPERARLNAGKETDLWAREWGKKHLVGPNARHRQTGNRCHDAANQQHIEDVRSDNITDGHIRMPPISRHHRRRKLW